MKKAKRLLALAVVILIAVSALTGCKSGSGTTSPSASTPAASTPNSASPGAPTPSTAKSLYPVSDKLIELDCFLASPGFLASVMADANDYPVMKRAQAVTNVHVKIIPIDQDAYKEQFAIMIASGDLNDFIGSAEENYPGGSAALVADKICIDLKPYLNDRAPDYMEKVYNKLPTIAKTTTNDAGNIVGIWSVNENVGGGPIIRKDWVDQLGLKLPNTYSELHDVLLAFKTQLNIPEPMLIQSNMTADGNSFSTGMDLNMFRIGSAITWQVDDNGVVSAACMTPQFKEYVTLLNQWYKDGIITDTCASMTNPRFFDEYITSNRVGFWCSNTSNMGRQFIEANDDKNYNAYPVKEPTKTGKESCDMGGGANSKRVEMSVSTQCQNPEAAIAYLNWFYTDEGVLYACFGEKGVSYTEDAGGKKAWTDIILKNPDGLEQMVAKSMYTNMVFPSITTQEAAATDYVTDGQRIATEVWGTNKTDKHMFYGDLTEEESQIYNAKSGDIATFIDETMNQFVFGVKPLSEFDSFTKMVETLGVADLTKLKQAAYDRYLKR